MDTPAKRYWHGLSIGIVIGAGVILCAVFVSQLNIFPLAAICNKDEGVGSCIREWLNAVAGIAAVITILLLLREQAFTREVAILQTLDTRARFVTGFQIARRLRSLAEQIRLSGFRWENPRGGRRPPIQPAYLVSNLLEIERLLLDEVWSTATNFDDRVMRNRASLVPIVADLLNTFLAGNLNFARQPQNRVTAVMIQENWQEDIDSSEIIRLSYRLDNLGDSVQRLAEELSNFRGTRYFHQPNEPNEPNGGDD